MNSGNAYPSFLSTARKTIHQKQPQTGTNVDAQAIGRYINNPIAVDIYGQPLRYWDFSNIRMDSHTTINMDGWISADMGPQSDLATSHTSGGSPPSFGDVRQMAVSEPSGGNQISSDGKPPSFNDVCRREAASQSEASCNQYEGPDDHEVQQIITSDFNQMVNKIGPVEHKQDLVFLFGSKISQSFGGPNMTFDSFDSTINYRNFLNPGDWAPPPQPSQRIRTYTKVYKRGSFGRSINISAYTGYDELKQNLARIFVIEGQLEDRVGWKLVYVDHENDVLLVGGDPWEEFLECVRCIKILSPQEVQQISLDGW